MVILFFFKEFIQYKIFNYFSEKNDLFYNKINEYSKFL